MQRYNNSDNSERLSEDILCEMLEFLQFKIRTRRLSLTDAEALQRLFSGIEITGTAEDFARFYGQSPINVRTVLCRKYSGRKIRAVLYSFRRFSAVVPAGWREKMRCIKYAENKGIAKTNCGKCNNLSRQDPSCELCDNER